MHWTAAAAFSCFAIAAVLVVIPTAVSRAPIDRSSYTPIWVVKRAGRSTADRRLKELSASFAARSGRWSSERTVLDLHAAGTPQPT